MRSTDGETQAAHIYCQRRKSPNAKLAVCGMPAPGFRPGCWDFGKYAQTGAPKCCDGPGSVGEDRFAGLKIPDLRVRLRQFLFSTSRKSARSAFLVSLQIFSIEHVHRFFGISFTEARLLMPVDRDDLSVENIEDASGHVMLPAHVKSIFNHSHSSVGSDKCI